MKSVLISIRPKWVEKIANGRKTIEVRKTTPDVPFKAYIYCTNQKINGEILLTNDKKVEGRNRGFRDNGDIPLAGKVIGEFVCDKVYKWECKNRLEISESFPIWRASYMLFVDDLEKTCLTYDDLWKYGKGKPLYGLHISDLKIYDKPKELSEFRKPCPYGDLPCWICPSCDRDENDNLIQCFNTVSRPPQSYMYVEEL